MGWLETLKFLVDQPVLLMAIGLAVTGVILPFYAALQKQRPNADETDNRQRRNIRDHRNRSINGDWR